MKTQVSERRIMGQNNERRKAGRPKNGRDRLAVHFSKKSDEWATPEWFVDGLRTEFAFTLDPCANHANFKCPKYFTKTEDGFSQSWGRECVFANPPYSQVGLWMKKAYESAQAGATVVCLVPARTDTRWWHAFAMKGEIRLLRGRLKFGNSTSSAPFPSALVIYHPSGFVLKAANFQPSKKPVTLHPPLP